MKIMFLCILVLVSACGPHPVTLTLTTSDTTMRQWHETSRDASFPPWVDTTVLDADASLWGGQRTPGVNGVPQVKTTATVIRFASGQAMQSFSRALEPFQLPEAGYTIVGGHQGVRVCEIADDMSDSMVLTSAAVSVRQGEETWTSTSIAQNFIMFYLVRVSDQPNEAAALQFAIQASDGESSQWTIADRVEMHPGQWYVSLAQPKKDGRPLVVLVHLAELAFPKTADHEEIQTSG